MKACLATNVNSTVTYYARTSEANHTVDYYISETNFNLLYSIYIKFNINIRFEMIGNCEGGTEERRSRSFFYKKAILKFNL